MGFCSMVFIVFLFFFFKQKTAYEMRISDWSSDVCSSDLSADRCVQVMGGTGVTDKTIVEPVFREVRAFSIYDGPTEVHKWSLAQKINRERKAGRARKGRQVIPLVRHINILQVNVTVRKLGRTSCEVRVGT